MSGLINLISQNLAKLFVLPILCLILIGASLVLFYFYKNKRIVKYIPSLVIGLIGLAIGIYSLGIFTTDKGLNTAWVAVFLGSSAFCGILTSFIIDLIISIKRNYKDLEKGRK
ncbi:MAG: hypothetical protein PUG67_07260 [Peptoniphilaceae bacterium]|nr:hypothetical protein [Peptoniphilaceae bacterium]MDY6019565.1 hypothetical protein [Anaerococcus sp.]